jgi:hypothetical protein
MSPDDLLVKIDAAIDKRKRIYGTIGTRSPEVPRVLTDYHNTGISFLLALRAVVELHKPIQIGGWVTGEPTYKCENCPRFGIRDGVRFEYEPYPCTTIQAIEKELSQ